MTLRRRVLVVVLVAAVALVGATAAVIARDEPSPPPSPDRNSHVRAVVLFAGDSNITLAAASIVRSLTWQDHNDNGYVPVMASRVGAAIRTYDCLEPGGCETTDYWKTRMGELLPAVSPDAVVTNLGVNDTLEEGTASTPGSASYDEKIDWFMKLFPSDTPVLWSNLPCSIEPPERASRCAEVNRELASAAGRWDNLTVVDWDAAATGHPEYMNTEFEVHLTSSGFQAWTQVILDALDARFPEP